MVELVDAIDDARQHGLDRDETDLAARTALGDFEHGALGVVDDFARLAAFRFERADDDLVARCNELAQHRTLAHDVGIGADVGGSRRIARERTQVGEPSDLVEHAENLEMARQGHGIARLAALDQGGRGFEDQPMVAAVEILGEHAIGNLVPGGGVQHETAQDRLLRLDRVRRQAQGFADTALESITAAISHALEPA